MCLNNILLEINVLVARSVSCFDLNRSEDRRRYDSLLFTNVLCSFASVAYINQSVGRSVYYASIILLILKQSFLFFRIRSFMNKNFFYNQPLPRSNNKVLTFSTHIHITVHINLVLNLALL